MKIQTVVYWVATVFFCSWMILNAYFYFTSEDAKQICRHFGFPDYFRVELASAKIIGVVALLLPVFQRKNKGMGIFWIYYSSHFRLCCTYVFGRRF